MTGPLILASASSTRASLLRGAGVQIEIAPADIDEAVIRDQGQTLGKDPAVIAAELAVAKAKVVSAQHPNAIVLGADQVLVHRNDLLSKASDLSEARAHLLRLRGETHRLISAAAIVRGGQTLWHDADHAELTMRDFSDAFLDSYLATTEDQILWSVGCYQLEGPGAQLFERVDGDYFTVLGLPLLAVLRALRETGHVAN